MTDDTPAATRRDGDRATAEAGQGARDSVTARSVTINRPAAELYRFWRDFNNLPKFMADIVVIDVVDATHSRWTVKAPGDREVGWTAEVTEDQPDRLIAWEGRGDIRNSGRVEFRDAGARGTIVTATIAYDPPGGALGKLVAKLFRREPAVQAAHDLRRFKQLMATGEIATPAMNLAQLIDDEESR
ncbi:cyclase [alpha proteobacterium AAP81b]|nr:cyclase [alpha proteobacterium AAP81b]